MSPCTSLHSPHTPNTLLLIKNGTIVNEGKSLKADIIIEDDLIKEIIPQHSSCTPLHSPALPYRK